MQQHQDKIRKKDRDPKPPIQAKGMSGIDCIYNKEYKGMIKH